MYRRLLFVLTLFLVLAVPHLDARAEEVRIATFNVYWLFDDQPPHLNWHDQRELRSYDQALTFVAEAAKRIDADVIALQEIEGPHIIEALNAKLGDKAYPYAWAGAGTDPFTGQDVAILSRYPNVTEPVRQYSALTETYTDFYGSEKVAALQKILRVSLEIARTPVTFFAVHLKSKRGAGESGGERLAQAKILRRLIRPVIDKQAHIVVLGDFNDEKESPPLGEILGRNDPGFDLSETAQHHAFKKDGGIVWTHEYGGEKSQLDHILVNRKLYHSITAGEVIRFDKSVSDHGAVAVTFDIKP